VLDSYLAAVIDAMMSPAESGPPQSRWPTEATSDLPPARKS
jgi:hypothetical protein